MMSAKSLKPIVKQVGVQIGQKRQRHSPIGIGLRFTPVVTFSGDTVMGALGTHSTYTTLN